MTDREACIVCNMIPGIGWVRFNALCSAFGGAAKIPETSRAELLDVKGIGAQFAEKIVEFDWDAELNREMAIAERGGVRIYTVFDEGYPEVLRTLYDPPLCLYVRGKLPEFPENAVAVVGSRRISSYGEAMTRQIAGDAALAGFTVVSGLAFGTDAVAHRAVLDVSGNTVGVIGAGLMHLHPKENIALARAIVESGGAVVSEFPLDFPVMKGNFPRRNRIVAGLCRGTIVIEAGVESGALITARLAMECGRDVFALPGRVDNPQAAGCHRLIKDGAFLIEHFDDVCAAWNLGLLPGLCQSSDAAAYDPDSFNDLDPNCAAVCNLLAGGEATFDEIHIATGIEAGTLLAALMRLELKLLVTRGENQHYRLLSKRK